MKKMFPVLCFIGLIFALGCGGGGGGGGETGISTPAANTTVYGTITVPSVSASGIAADITYTNDSTLLTNFAKSGVCTVNGKQMAFSLATATQYFYIFEITPAEKYDIQFMYKNFTLRSMVAHSSNSINKNMNLNTTAEALIFEKFQFTAAKIKYFEIDQTLKEGLAQKMLTLLQTPTVTKDTYQSALASELAGLNPDALGTDLTPARDLTGTWKGTNVVYYEYNLDGQRSVKNTANMTLTLKQSGNTITGDLETTITKYERLADLYYPPVGMASQISGKVSSTNLTFSGRSFSGTFTFTSDIMTGTLKNTDLDTFFGFESDTNAIKLLRK